MRCRRLHWMIGSLLALVVGASPAWAQQEVDASKIYLGASGSAVQLLAGSGSPEGSVTAPVGSVYLRTDSGALYVKASGSGNTGWTTASFGSQTANTVFAGPTNGSAAAPTFRALVYADLPSGSGTWSATPTISGAVTLSSTLGVTGVATFASDIDPAVNYTSNLGDASKKYLTIHGAELWVQTLVAEDVMATIGGRVVVAPTTTLTADLADDDTTMVVKHDVLASGDRVRLESGGQVEWIAVTSAPSGTGPYTYSITRDLDGSGANNWVAGDALVSTGTTGDGFIDLYSTSGVLSGTGPTIVGNVRTGTTYNNIEPRWAIGNLNGLYGYAADTYGAAFGTPSGAWIKIDPTNGVRIGHNTTTRINLDASTGAASFTGSITSASGSIGGWTIGASSLTSGSGSTTVGLDSGGTNPAIYAGSSTPGSAPFRVSQDGTLVATNATITGHITATGGDISGALAANSITTDKLVVKSTGAALNSDPDTKDITAWTLFSGTPWVSATVTDGAVGLDVFRTPTGTRGFMHGNRIPVDGSKSYVVRAWARKQAGANGTLYIGALYFDADGEVIGANWAAANENAGSTTWVAYSGAILPGGIPAGSKTFAVAAALNWDGGDTGYYEIQGLRLEEQVPSVLIQDGAIVAAKIDAGAVTADKIAAGTITADKIASGTITSTQIQAGSIDADRLNVSSLSAISADLGTVTAGTINGAEAFFGSSAQVALNSNGITIVAADNAPNRYKFDNGSFIGGKVGSSDILVSSSAGDIWWEIANGALIVFEADRLGPAPGNSSAANLSLGASDAPWKDLHISGVAYIGTLTDGPVCANGGELLMCGDTPLQAVTQQRIAELEARIEALEAALLALKEK